MASLLGFAVPAISATSDTRVHRHGERVGSLVHQGASRFKVEDINDGVEAEVLNVAVIKPLDSQVVVESLASTRPSRSRARPPGASTIHTSRQHS